MISVEAICAKLLALAARRRDGAMFCPSEVARVLSDDWRPLMPRVREVAAVLVDDGTFVCAQRGLPAILSQIAGRSGCPRNGRNDA
jgi:hypothetical protein